MANFYVTMAKIIDILQKKNNKICHHAHICVQEIAKTSYVFKKYMCSFLQIFINFSSLITIIKV